MKNKKFEIGDIVHLNSGSPKMTVVTVSNDYIYVAWINWETNVEERASFHKDCLELDSEVQAKKYKGVVVAANETFTEDLERFGNDPWEFFE